MARDDFQFNLRIPHALNLRLRDAAAANGRSVTAELVQRLQRTLDEDDAKAARPAPEEIVALLGGDSAASAALAELGALSLRMAEVTRSLGAKQGESSKRDEKKKAPAKKR